MKIEIHHALEGVPQEVDVEVGFLTWIPPRAPGDPPATLGMMILDGTGDRHAFDAGELLLPLRRAMEVYANFMRAAGVVPRQILTELVRASIDAAESEGRMSDKLYRHRGSMTILTIDSEEGPDPEVEGLGGSTT